MKINVKSVDNLSIKISIKLEETPADNYDAFRITLQYKSLLNAKRRYFLELRQDTERRESGKKRQFSKLLLYIKLPKFKRFKSTLPDLLRDNFLNEALSLIKRFEDIDKIWKRLKKAYHDSKLLLLKKLADVNNLGPFRRAKNTSKCAKMLSKNINVIRNLIHLAEKNNINRMLYNNDSNERIYKLLEDNRIINRTVTRVINFL